MNLFLDVISSVGNILLFDDQHTIIDHFSWGVKGIEVSSLIPSVDRVLKKNSVNYFDLENIFVVNGPGSFTGIRMIVLYVNTLNTMIHKNLIPLSYMDLFNDYPIIKASSKTDAFIQISCDSEIEVLPNLKIMELLKEKNITKVCGEISPEALPGVQIFDKVNYSNIIDKIYAQHSDIGMIARQKIDPLYIKKPTIY